MGVFTKASKTAWEELTKPRTFAKGEQFEDYVRACLFPATLYGITQVTHHYSSNKGDYFDTSKEPDHRFKLHDSNIEFFAVVKYYPDFYQGGVEWCKPYQRKRYMAINARTPILLALGVGRKPHLPQHVYVVPLRDVRYHKLFHSFLKKYEVQANQSVARTQLAKLLQSRELSSEQQIRIPYPTDKSPEQAV